MAVTFFKKNKKYILLILLLVAGTFFYTYLHKKDSYFSPKTHMVELQDVGFYPSSLRIYEGDSVTFKTNRSHVFWPASDPHPTHGGLVGFDPGYPLNPKDSWTYTFNTAGLWRYHDHENVSFRGEVLVLEKENNSDLPQACGGVCFDERIREVVQEEGIDEAFALFQQAFISGTLPRSCHWTAHQIGEEAYELFKHGVEFPITQATSYCGYGFFHGFLEGLLRENPDVEFALSFCKKVEDQLGELGLQNCYHGIGHGYTEDPPEPEVWGDFNAMIKPGIKICEFLLGDSFRNLNLCLTGVFTVPAGFASDGEFGLSIDHADPFSFCRTQPYRYQKACYGEFAPKLDTIINWDLSKLPTYTDTISDPKVERLVVWVVPSVMMARDILSDDYSQYINGCRENFEGRLQDICFGGTILGFYSHGIPGEEYRKALEFCNLSTLLSRERELCYSEALRQARTMYGMQKIEEVCTLVPAEFKRHCKETLYTPPYDDPDFD